MYAWKRLLVGQRPGGLRRQKEEEVMRRSPKWSVIMTPAPSSPSQSSSTLFTNLVSPSLPNQFAINFSWDHPFPNVSFCENHVSASPLGLCVLEEDNRKLKPESGKEATHDHNQTGSDFRESGNTGKLSEESFPSRITSDPVRKATPSALETKQELISLGD